MKIIYVCSPLRGDIQKNVENALEYCREIALNGDIPIAPHVYFTQFLNDDIQLEREIGTKAGIKLLDICDEMIVFSKNISEGMKAEIAYCKAVGKPIYYSKRAKS